MTYHSTFWQGMVGDFNEVFALVFFVEVLEQAVADDVLSDGPGVSRDVVVDHFGLVVLEGPKVLVLIKIITFCNCIVLRSFG